MRAWSRPEPLPVAAEICSAREGVPDALARERVEEVDLVQDELDRDVVGADLREDGLHGPDRLPEPLLAERRVHDMEHEVGDERLLQRRRKAFDELSWRRRMKPTVSVTR